LLERAAPAPLARPHDPEQMGTFVRSGATALERLLERLELREVGANAGLYRLIEGLTRHGLGDRGVRALHALRTAANADKHDAQTYQVSGRCGREPANDVSASLGDGLEHRGAQGFFRLLLSRRAPGCPPGDGRASGLSGTPAPSDAR
jgi:hypothetical protein